MKKVIVVILSAWAAVTARAALPQPDLIARVHYAGDQRISADANFHNFTNEFCSAEAQALASQTLDKLARAPYSWIKVKTAAGATDGVALLRPLGNDLLASEWFFEARDTANGSPEYALAIRLNDARARVWSRDLAAVLRSWTGMPLPADSAGNWQLKKHVAPNLVTFSRRGEWVLVDCGQDTLSLGERVLAEANREGADTNWLTLDVNWPRLEQSFPELKALDLPETQAAVFATQTGLHVNGNLYFPQNLEASLPAWQIPTNAIHEPFTSFTAARGFASWLGSRAWAAPYSISPTPDQCYIWGSSGMPLATFTAVPVPNSAEALEQVNVRLQQIFSVPRPENPIASTFRVTTANGQVHLEGMPFASPFVQAVKSPSGQFLLAGGFPNTPRGRPLPAELFQVLGQRNLMYYHWEITAQRLPQMLQLSQLSLLLSWKKQLDSKSAAFNWLHKIGPTLGNTVTEAYQTAPDQITFKRSAPGGLTAFELLALANWLEAPDFPGCDLRMPARNPLRFKHFNGQPPGAMPRPMAMPAPTPH